MHEKTNRIKNEIIYDRGRGFRFFEKNLFRRVLKYLDKYYLAIDNKDFETAKKAKNEFYAGLKVLGIKDIDI